MPSSLKHIHQIWYQGKENIPEKYDKYRESIREKNPEFIIIFWGEKEINNLVKNHYPEYEEWFNNLPLMIQKIDVAKCLILNIYGGIYVDMDIECIKSLNEIYDDKYIVVGEIGMKSIENFFLKKFLRINRALINNGIIFSPKRHKFWDFYIPFLKKSININPQLLEKMINELYVAVTTGPANLSKGIEIYPYKDQIKVMESKYLEPELVNSGTKSDNAYIIHHHTLTWCSSFFIFFLKTFTGSSLLAIFLTIILSIIIIVSLLIIIKKIISHYY